MDSVISSDTEFVMTVGWESLKTQINAKKEVHLKYVKYVSYLSLVLKLSKFIWKLKLSEDNFFLIYFEICLQKKSLLIWIISISFEIDHFPPPAAASAGKSFLKMFGFIVKLGDTFFLNKGLDVPIH